MPSKRIRPNVMASVIGMLSAMSSAERHSQKPTSATSTTRTIASYRLDMKRSTFSRTCSGWSLTLRITRSSGRSARRLSSSASTALPKSATWRPDFIVSERVIERVRCQRPSASFHDENER
jgi:hypothetical protein